MYPSRFDSLVASVLAPAQVALYLPDQSNPSYGVVRAIVHDSTDRQASGSSVPLYLDSNGCISDINCDNAKNLSLFTTTPSWHHIGLTTIPGGGAGYQMYIDGQLSAQMAPGNYTDYLGGVHVANGGGAMNLTGDLTLCARSDLDETVGPGTGAGGVGRFGSAVGGREEAAGGEAWNGARAPWKFRRPGVSGVQGAGTGRNGAQNTDMHAVWAGQGDR